MPLKDITQLLLNNIHKGGSTTSNSNSGSYYLAQN